MIITVLPRSIIRNFGLIFLILITTIAFSQKATDTTQLETLFGKGNLLAQGYGSAQLGFSKLDDTGVLLVVAEGGVIINRKIGVGATVTGIISSQTTDVYYAANDEETAAVVRGIYGGAKFEPLLKPHKLVHISFPTVVGGGMLFYMTDRSNYVDSNGKYNRREIDSDPFFYIEPGAAVEFNITKFMRFELALTYRYVPTLSLNSTPDNGFNKVTTYINFKFGKF
jgi:hypothetical protein